MSYRPDICIHHAPCQDGFTAAWAVWKRWPDIEFVPGVYGQAPPDVAGKHVLIVDFSYKRDVLEAMSESAATITVLDHHKTAQLDLETFAILNPVTADDIDLVLKWSQPGLGNIRAEFDMTRSGAMIAWQFCHPGSPVPAMVKHVQDRDLWRFELEGTREIAADLFSRPYEFHEWSEVATQLEFPDERAFILAQGAAIERKHHKDVGELLDLTQRYMVIGGHRVPVANLPYTMASDAANILAEGNAFGACYFDRGDGLRQFSLRAQDGGADVSQIAAAYGGGGHAKAAGFQVPLRVGRGRGVSARGPVTQAWVNDLPFMQQTVLLTAIRGPDGVAKYSPPKQLLRWYRRCILLSAMDGCVLGAPWDDNGGSFTGPSLSLTTLQGRVLNHAQGRIDAAEAAGRLSESEDRVLADTAYGLPLATVCNVLEDECGGWEPLMDDQVAGYLQHLDAIPHHFQLHFLHAAEIVGYKHSDDRIRAWWAKTYVRLVHDMHLWPETVEQMDRRLGDNRDQWLERNDPATVA